MSTAAHDDLLLVCGVSRLDVLQECLLASPCLARGGLPLVMRWNAQSAAEAFNAVLDQRPAQRWVVWVHQDVRLPAGWDSRFSHSLAEAQAQLGALAVVGVYGVAGRGAQARHVGHVVDRGLLLQGAAPLPCRVDSLDELLFAVRTDSGLRLDPALGFDFYATDLVLQAQAAGLQAAVVDAVCEHWSDTPREPPVPEAIARRVAANGTAFERKWQHQLPVTTPCFAIAQLGDVAEMAMAMAHAPAPAAAAAAAGKDTA